MGLNISGNSIEMMRKLAKKSGMDEAMAGMQGQMNPQMQLQSNSIFNMAGNQQNMTDPMSMMKGGMQMPPMPPQEGNGIMQNIMNFFKGGPSEDDMAKMTSPLMINGQDFMQQGPQKPGDPQFEGQPTGINKTGSSQMKDNQASQGANMGDPDAYAQKYADAQGISLEEAKEQLKAKYGDPTRRQ